MKNNSQNLSSQKNLRCPFYLTKYESGGAGTKAGAGFFINELNEIYEFQGGGSEQREMEPFLTSP